MKATYNWLKDFVDIRIPPQKLAGKLTMAGLEVTSLEERNGDFVFEIEVTSNRPDWLSIIGIAREVAAITGRKLRNVTSQKSQVTGKALRPATCNLRPATCNPQPLSIKVKDTTDCPLYTAKIITAVNAGPSPDWLKKRLELIGCRSTNSIVDITNYILFEWGQPLHAFDLDKLNGNAIFVRRARDNEKIITIDGQERILNPGVLVIADKAGPVAIAGVMGGKDTEVTQATKNILLESAVFNPVLVRRARQNLGLQSDSSYRFERGVNLEAVEQASWQATKLIQASTAGSCILAKSSGAPRIKTKQVLLRLSTVNKILGTDIAASEAKKILNSLGFKVGPGITAEPSRTRHKISGSAGRELKNNFAVKVPSHRQDVNSEIDLLEEIARIWGYERVRPTVPAFVPQIPAYGAGSLVSLIKNILVSLGLNEVITYSLVDKALLQAFELKDACGIIEILNPLSKEQEVLRPALIPSLTACVAYNLNQKQDYVNVFEIAKIFSEGPVQPNEELALGIALCGTKSLLLEQGSVKDKLGALHLKGTLEVLFQRIGIKDYSFTAANPYETAVYVGDQKVGLIVSLSKGIQDKLEIKNKDVAAAQILLEKVLPYVNLQKKFSGLPVYPGISRDISLVLEENIPADSVLKAIREKASSLLKEARITDFYKGKQIPEGSRGLTVSCLYRSDERTLTEAEVEPIHSLVSRTLVEAFHAQIR